MIVDAGGFEVSRGTALARELAARYGKPLFVAELGAADVTEHAAAWLRAQCESFGKNLTLAIGGARESEAPGIYARAVAFIGALLVR